MNIQEILSEHLVGKKVKIRYRQFTPVSSKLTTETTILDISQEGWKLIAIDTSGRKYDLCDPYTRIEFL